MSDLAALRKEYEFRGVCETDLSPNPLQQFKAWFDVAIAQCQVDWIEPNAMSLATADRNGFVTNRTVLLKHFDERGFTFFTHYRSEKGEQIAANSQVGLLFHWPYLGRQIRIEGIAVPTSREVSATYFHSRPRGAQIGASISDQSRAIRSRAALEQLWKSFSQRYENQPIPLPDDWGGYLVMPRRMEFWQGRADRMHDRFQYCLDAQSRWVMQRLSP